MNEMQTVLFRIIVLSLAVGLISAVPVKKSMRRVISAGCGALLLIALLGPLLSVREIDPGQYLERFQMDEDLIDEAVRDGQAQTGALIKEQTEEYILQRAGALGAEVRAEVTLAALSEHYQYPYAVTLTGRWTQEQRQELTAYLSQTLGIPPERQTWREES